MKRRALFFAIVLMIESSTSLVAQTRSSQNASFCSINSEPRTVWRQMIEAKGGVVRLHNVQNLVASSFGRARNKVQSYPIRIESLYVFPKKWWIWDDQRPSHFGLHMSMRNMDSKQGYDLTAGGRKFSALAPIGASVGDNDMAAITLELLLETKWVQPVPKRLFVTQYRGQKTIGIEVTAAAIRAEFILDQRSCLPLQLVTYNSSGAVKTSFGSYIEVHGIQMPSAVTYETEDGNITYTRRYEFNVDYDADIFRAPPPFERGAAAWNAK